MTRFKYVISAVLLILAIGLSIGSVYGTEEAVTLQGTLIDSACAGAHSADLGTFIKTHTKECALMPACEKSGYNIYSEGSLYKFSAKSSQRVAEFLKQPAGTLQVRVKAHSEKGGLLELISIENM